MTDDSEDLDTPVDPDIALITDYLGGELSRERAAEVRHRLETDAEFFDRVILVIHAWNVPPLHVRDPIPPERLDRLLADFYKRTGIRNRREGDKPS